MANLVEATRGEAVAITRVGAAFIWAGFIQEDSGIPNSAASTVIQLLGQHWRANIREIASMDPGKVTTELETWSIGGARPNIAARTKVKVHINAIRIVEGAAYRGHEEKRCRKGG